MLKTSMNLIFAALILLSLGIFTSISVGAVAHVFLVLASIAFFLHDPKEYWPILKTRRHNVFSLMAYILVIIISIVFNWNEIEHPIKNIIKIKYFLIPLMSIPALIHFFTLDFNKKKIKWLLYLFLAATTVASISGLIGLYTGFNPIKFKAACHATRACGLYGMYMTYGYGISLFMVLITGAIVHIDKMKEYVSPFFLIPAWIINFVGLILSYARGGLLGFLISAPFFALKKDPLKFLLISLFMGTISASSVLLSPKLQDMIFNRSHSNQQRLAFYETALKAASEKPVIGWGYKNFEPNVVKLKEKYQIAYPEYGADAHNIFLEVLATTGIVGIMVFIYFLFSWIRTAFVGQTIIHQISFPFIISLLISGQVQNTFGDGENLFLIMLIWSIMVAAPITKDVDR